MEETVRPQSQTRALVKINPKDLKKCGQESLLRRYQASQLKEQRGCSCPEKIYYQILSKFSKQNISPLEVSDFLTSNGFKLQLDYTLNDETFLNAYRKNGTLVELFNREPLDMLGNRIIGLDDYALMNIRCQNNLEQRDFRGN